MTTGYVFSFSPHQNARAFQFRSALENRGRARLSKEARGMPGVRCTRGWCKKCTGSRHRFTGIKPAFPARWFYGFLRALPGDRALLSPSPLRSVSFLTVPIRESAVFGRIDAAAHL